MSNQQSIALVGLSGVGKSSVGRRLAARLGWPLRDTDTLIAETSGRTVAQIFAASGEPYFRDLESAALHQALSIQPCIVSTGGGIVLRPENRALLRAHAFVVWLDAPTETLVARLQAHDEARPLIGGVDPAARLEALRAARAGLYAEVAHANVDAANQALDEICRQVLHLFAQTTGEDPPSFSVPQHMPH
jgi:shikimate kinase